MRKLLLFSINKQALRKKEPRQQAGGMAKQGKGNMHRRGCCTGHVQTHSTSACSVNHLSLYCSSKQPSWWATALGKNRATLNCLKYAPWPATGPDGTIWNSLSPYLLSTSFFRRGNGTELNRCAADSLSDCLVAVARTEDFLEQFKTKSRGKFMCARAQRCTQPCVPPFSYTYSIMGYIYSLRNSESSSSMPRPVPDGWKCQESPLPPCFGLFFFFQIQTRNLKERK